jgi:hypothetical protein
MKKILASLTTVAAIASLSVGVSAMPAEAKSKKPKVYKSCSALHKDYPHGIAKSGAVDLPKAGYKAVKNFKTNGAIFTANKKLDTDGDRIACELIGAKKPYEARTLVNVSGSQDQNTMPFTTKIDPWGVVYVYDCRLTYLGYSNFVVWLYKGNSPVELIANNVDEHGSGTQIMYDPKGTYHLEIETDCTYNVQAVG